MQKNANMQKKCKNAKKDKMQKCENIKYFCGKFKNRKYRV